VPCDFQQARYRAEKGRPEDPFKALIKYQYWEPPCCVPKTSGISAALRKGCNCRALGAERGTAASFIQTEGSSEEEVTLIAMARVLAYLELSSTPLMRVYLLVRFLGVSAFLAAIASAAEWRVHAQWNREGLVRFTTDRDQTVAGPEPIVRWQSSTPKLLRDSENSATLALTPTGLTATVSKGSTGQYRELVFTVNLRNEGKESVTGAVLPPLSQWRDSPDSISGHSPEFLMITAATAEIGSLGVHRSWSPGAEFEADTFVTGSSSRWRRTLRCGLLLREKGNGHNSQSGHREDF
jgi:hypothetical protein